MTTAEIFNVLGTELKSFAAEHAMTLINANDPEAAMTALLTLPGGALVIAYDGSKRQNSTSERDAIARARFSFYVSSRKPMGMDGKSGISAAGATLPPLYTTLENLIQCIIAIRLATDGRTRPSLDWEDDSAVTGPNGELLNAYKATFSLLKVIPQTTA